MQNKAFTKTMLFSIILICFSCTTNCMNTKTLKQKDIKQQKINYKTKSEYFLEFFKWLLSPCFGKTSQDLEKQSFITNSQENQSENQTDTKLDLSFKIDLEDAIKAFDKKNNKN